MPEHTAKCEQHAGRRMYVAGDKEGKQRKSKVAKVTCGYRPWSCEHESHRIVKVRDNASGRGKRGVVGVWFRGTRDGYRVGSKDREL